MSSSSLRDDARRKEDVKNNSDKKNRTNKKLSSSSPIGDLLAKLDVAYLSVNFEEMEIGSVKDLRERYFLSVVEKNFFENKRKEKEEILTDVANELCFGEKKYAERVLEEMEEIERRE
jgi:hypothetical protein